MTDERELDRAIDKAARDMISREPSRALSYGVMARVRERQVSTPRAAWLKAACICAAAIVVAHVAFNRPAPEIRPAATQQVARTERAPQPARRAESAREALVDSRPLPRPRRPVVETPAATLLPFASVDIVSIEPIAADPIVVAPIELPGLDPVAPASIEAIKIEPLTIEPLAASND